MVKDGSTENRSGYIGDLVHVFLGLEADLHLAGSGSFCLIRALSAAPLGNNRATSRLKSCSPIAPAAVIPCLIAIGAISLAAFLLCLAQHSICEGDSFDQCPDCRDATDLDTYARRASATRAEGCRFRGPTRDPWHEEVQWKLD